MKPYEELQKTLDKACEIALGVARNYEKQIAELEKSIGRYKNIVKAMRHEREETLKENDRLELALNDIIADRHYHGIETNGTMVKGYCSKCATKIEIAKKALEGK